MIIDFYTYNLKKALANEVERAQSAETALKTDTFADVVYNASGKTIDFYNGFNQKIDSIDASDFVIDGMVENVTLSGNILTISFNTESGKQDIDIDLSEFIDPQKYWTSAETKTYVDSSLSEKQDTLVSGTNIKTINGNSILGSGNIELDLSGYTTTAQTEELKNKLQILEETISRALNELYTNKADKTEIPDISNLVSSTSIRTIVKLTQAEYDALTTKDNNTFYVIVG